MRLDSNYVRLHVVDELQRAPFASVRYDDFDVIVVDLPKKQSAAVCIMERETSLIDILNVFREHGSKQIHSVFLLWCEMLLPEHGDIFEPPEWLRGLVTLHNQKVYAYKTVGDQVAIFPVMFKRVGVGAERLVLHGANVRVTDLGCAFIEVSGSEKLDGRWLMADFVEGRGEKRTYHAHIEQERRRFQQQHAPTPAHPMLAHFRALGIAENADWDQVKRAYRDLARQFHPDLNPAAAATGKMQQINHAYAQLMLYYEDKQTKG